MGSYIVTVTLVRERFQKPPPTVTFVVHGGVLIHAWKEDSAEILVGIESPFQQSRRGILAQGIDWALGLQGQVSKVSIDPTKKERRLDGRLASADRKSLLEYWSVYFCVRR